MKATLMLCDYARVAEGKLYISGGGWSIMLGPMRGFIAALLKVSWDQANRRISLAFSLLDQDGNAIAFGDPQQNQILMALEVGRPAGLPRGTDLDVPIAVELPTLTLEPGTYEWVLHIDGRGDENWRLPFLIVRPPVLPQLPAV